MSDVCFMQAHFLQQLLTICTENGGLSVTQVEEHMEGMVTARLLLWPGGTCAPEIQHSIFCHGPQVVLALWQEPLLVLIHVRPIMQQRHCPALGVNPEVNPTTASLLGKGDIQKSITLMGCTTKDR